MQSMTVLIVDDEKAFLTILSEEKSAWAGDYDILTAGNGQIATEILQSKAVDLVVTDLKMPVMDGFELLAYLNNMHPDIPAIVMTAFGTSDIESKIENLGAIQYLEKPIDMHTLAEKVDKGLKMAKKGYIHGITLPSFLQVLEAERKTCTLSVQAGKHCGKLFIIKGVLVQAKTENIQGEEAALKILAWDDTEIEIKNVCNVKTTVIKSSMTQLIMEAFRMRDEEEQQRSEEEVDFFALPTDDNNPEAGQSHPSKINSQQEETTMAVKEKLQELTSLDGFVGVGLFTPTGESLALMAASGDTTQFKDVGVLANNVLLNAQKASLDMGTGRGQLVHVEAENAHFLVRCLNEGSDPLKSQPGKTHIHMVLILKDDSSIGMAKLKVAKIIADLADEFRI